MDRHKLKLEQYRLAEKILTNDAFEEINYIAGCDQSYTKDNKVISAVVVIDAKTMKFVDKAYAAVDCRMPYIPGYLFYREGPAIVEAFSRLRQKPDLLIVDGNGILHPRRIGMASHLGLALDIATIGVAKSLMMGRVSEGKVEVDKEIRAIELRTREFANPLYVSPGHRVGLQTALEYVKKLIIHPHKMPEPLHLAHRYSKKLREQIEAGNDKAKIESAGNSMIEA